MRMAADTSPVPPKRRWTPKSLYREEIYTDRKVGTLRVLVPVKAMARPIPRARRCSKARRS